MLHRHRSCGVVSAPANVRPKPLIQEAGATRRHSAVGYCFVMAGGGRLAGIAAVLAVLAAAAPAGAVTITEFPLLNPAGQEPRYIKLGPEGDLWFAEGGGAASGIVQMNVRGEVVARFIEGHDTVDLAFAPDGTLFWAGGESIGERQPGPNRLIQEAPATEAYATFVAPGGQWRWTEKQFVPVLEKTAESVCTAPARSPQSRSCHGTVSTGRITGLAVDAAGNWWGTYYEDNTLHELAEPEDHVVPLPENSGPARVVLGPDGALWVTMSRADTVDRVAVDGSRTRVAQLAPGSEPNDIAVGPEGALWVTEYGNGKIARVTTAGAVTEYAIPTAGSFPIGITRGPDGAMWFTESKAARIGRLVPDAPQTDLHEAGFNSGGGSNGAPTARDTTAPRFTRVPALRPPRFRGPASRRSRSVRKGSVLTFSLSEAATLKLQIEILLPGRRKRGGCVAPSRSNRSRPRCTRHVPLGTLSATGVTGANGLPFSGRVSGRALRPGSYTLTAVATDAAGNSSAPAKASFTIAP